MNNILATIIGLLSWIAPAEREDGTPLSLSEISEYRVYYGEQPGNYIYQTSIAPPLTEIPIMDLGRNLTTYHMVVTCVDADGRESAFSVPVARTFNVADINKDAIVNGADLAYMVRFFFANDYRADLNRDGIINGADLAILRREFFK